MQGVGWWEHRLPKVIVTFAFRSPQSHREVIAYANVSLYLILRSRTLNNRRVPVHTSSTAQHVPLFRLSSFSDIRPDYDAIMPIFLQLLVLGIRQTYFGQRLLQLRCRSTRAFKLGCYQQEENGIWMASNLWTCSQDFQISSSSKTELCCICFVPGVVILNAPKCPGAL